MLSLVYSLVNSKKTVAGSKWQTVDTMANRRNTIAKRAKYTYGKSSA